MTPDDLNRELEDLDRRFSPPAIDPTHLLQLEIRAADLAQENADLRSAIAMQESKIAELQTASEQQAAELFALKTAQQKRKKEEETERSEWLRKQQYWSALAVRERSDSRAQQTQWIRSAGLAVAGIAVCLGFWIAGAKYWTFTHDDQLRMMQTAARDKADAVAAYRNANKDLAEVVRLRNQLRHTKKTTPASKPSGENAGGTEKQSSR